MYVCICNALRESEIRRAIADGADTPDDVYARLDCEPECGTCSDYIDGMILAQAPLAKVEAA
jgi:bacterioferritin-associated ferredoxin